MIFYFDTSILLPAIVEAHPSHQQAKTMFEEAVAGNNSVCLGLHSFAELYTNLTRFPLGDRIHPTSAQLIIDALKKIVTVVVLSKTDYFLAQERCASKGLVSGIIFDSIHFQSALKGGAKVLYTANTKDFERLLNADDQIELRSI